MTNTDLAVPVRQPDPEYDRLARLGQWLAASESGANDTTSRGMTAALRLYYAQELGLPPLAAAELSVIKGRLFVGAKLLRALATRRGYRVRRVYITNEKCTAALIDMNSGEEIGRVDYTIQDAKTAGLIRDGSAWKTHPARMLWARASKYVLDDYAPEVTLGIYSDEEGAEILGRPALLPDDVAEGYDPNIDFGPLEQDPYEEPADPSEFPPAGTEDPHAKEPGPP